MIIWFDNKKQQTIWWIVLIISIVLGLICNKLFGEDVYSVFLWSSVLWILFGNFILKLLRVGK